MKNEENEKAILYKQYQQQNDDEELENPDIEEDELEAEEKKKNLIVYGMMGVLAVVTVFLLVNSTLKKETTKVLYKDPGSSSRVIKTSSGQVFSVSGNVTEEYTSSSMNNTGEYEQSLEELRELVGQVENGEDGKNGKDGQDGQAGKNGEDGRDGMAGVDGKDGKDGKDGVDGRDGIDGKNGRDGEAGVDAYTYVRYAEDMAGNGMTVLPTDKSYYIGIYTGNNPSAPGIATEYTWSKYRGDDGVDGQDGENGVDSYTHVRYAEDIDGNGMTEQPTDHSYYIGIYVGNSSSAPDAPDQYTWSKYRGDNGVDGQDGQDGKDGQDGIDSYTYVRYAEDINGNGMAEQPTDRSYYIGIYVGNSSNAPETADQYTWSKYRGNDSASATYDAETNTVILTITK